MAAGRAGGTMTVIRSRARMMICPTGTWQARRVNGVSILIASADGSPWSVAPPYLVFHHDEHAVQRANKSCTEKRTGCGTKTSRLWGLHHDEEFGCSGQRLPTQHSEEQHKLHSVLVELEGHRLGVENGADQVPFGCAKPYGIRTGGPQHALRATTPMGTTCPHGATCTGDNSQHLLPHVGPGLDDVCPTEQRVPLVLLGAIDGACSPSTIGERRLQHRHAFPCRKNPAVMSAANL